MIDYDEQIKALANDLKLPIFSNYREFTTRDAAFNENLAALLTEEATRRNNEATQRRIKQAGFPIRKSINTFKNRLPHLTQDDFTELATCKFIAAKANVCALGPSGVGYDKSTIM